SKNSLILVQELIYKQSKINGVISKKYLKPDTLVQIQI
ncbi:hypothetical protein H312_03562, partial [Anncaliia algerae PRA339]